MCSLKLWLIFVTLIFLQFYPFGNDSGDAVLSYNSGSDGSSLSVLPEDFVFFNQPVRIVYVC